MEEAVTTRMRKADERPKAGDLAVSHIPRYVRTEQEIRDALRTVCRVMWDGYTTDHVWSIPADPKRDIDLILSDALAELSLRRKGRWPADRSFDPDNSAWPKIEGE